MAMECDGKHCSILSEIVVPERDDVYVERRCRHCDKVASRTPMGVIILQAKRASQEVLEKYGLHDFRLSGDGIVTKGP